MKAGTNGLLGIDPGFLVHDWLDLQVQWLVLDGGKGWIGLNKDV